MTRLDAVYTHAELQAGVLMGLAAGFALGVVVTVWNQLRTARTTKASADAPAEASVTNPERSA